MGDSLFLLYNILTYYFQGDDGADGGVGERGQSGLEV